MAALVLTNCSATIGTSFLATAPGLPGTQTIAGTVVAASGLTLDTYLRKVTLSDKVAMQDSTTFGSGGYTAQLPGMKSADISIELNQDFASSAIDTTFYGYYAGGSLVYLDVKPTNAARSATNPSYVYACYVGQYEPVNQKVGDLAVVTIPLMVTGAFTRLTA